MTNNSELFSGALAVCQLMLRGAAAAAGGALAPDAIRQKVDEILAMPTYADVDRDGLLAALEQRFTVFTPRHRTLGSDDGHQPWLNAKKGVIRWRYWERYKLLLEERLPESALNAIDEVSDDILGRLEDPERPGPWDRRGLVAGNVQSGKTASYTGLISKAADAGYKVIIVLAGLHDSLRSQTQMRLDEGFLGFMSEPRTAQGQHAFRTTGVGHIDNSIRANTGTNRTQKGDFSRPVANQFGIHPGGLPLLFVLKKNTRVLENVMAWLRSCSDGADEGSDRRFIRHVPVLVIDDEADLASVDTRAQLLDENGEPDPDHNPTLTNELIRRILRSFEKVAYVGYTATPFANIFIYDKGYTPALGDDLFPRSFIVNLPAGTNYFGPAKVFGITPDEDAGLDEIPALPLVRVVDDHADSNAMDEEGGWMPPKLVNKTGHIPLFDGKETVPPSLRKAILSFILATAVRTIRGTAPAHNTMLVHVARFTKIQKRVGQQVERELKEVIQRLQNGDGDRRPRIGDELRDLWDSDFVPTNQTLAGLVDASACPPLPGWHEVEQELRTVAPTIVVKLINGSAKDVLDYEEHKVAGMNVIAIGGDKLARGLTLEGLTVSYFLRASRMYDTLMQMGRWFGYRENYLDVCRLYTTADIVGWFAHIAAAGEELSQQFQHMVDVGGTPKDYGLKVRSHPLLLVTSAVKMRNGTELKLSFSGDISETIIFDRNPAWIARNFEVTEHWLGGFGKEPRGGSKGGYTWDSIDVESVLGFLSSYTSHPAARRANIGLLTKYISAQKNQDELITWTVHLVSSGLSDAAAGRIAGLAVGLVKRAPFPELQPLDRHSIRRLVNPADELVDFDKTFRAKALEATVESWRTSQEPKRETPPETAAGREIRKLRPVKNGLLLLYPLDPAAAGIASEKPIIGLAISFPKSDSAREVSYIVDNVFVRTGDDESL